MNIGKAIKTCRSQRDMTQTDLAKAANISSAYLSLLERGERSDPGIETIESIAKALCIHPSILLFIASDETEFRGIDQDLVYRLSHAALNLMSKSA